MKSVLLAEFGSRSVKFCRPEWIDQRRPMRLGYRNLLALFERHFGKRSGFDLAFSQVALKPAQRLAVRGFCAGFSLSHRLRSKTSACGVRNGYRRVDQLGADRFLALVGAYHLHGQQEQLVVDAGTALSIDLLAVDGAHLGGFLLPGLGLSQACARSRFGHLALGLDSLGVAESAGSGQLMPGASTEECFSQGLLLASVAAVEKAAWLGFGRDLDGLSLSLSGGDGALLAHALGRSEAFDPWLVFRGMDLCRRA